jgi:hypothetical protein
MPVETSLVVLLEGFESVLIRSHDEVIWYVLVTETAKSPSIRWQAHVCRLACEFLESQHERVCRRELPSQVGLMGSGATRQFYRASLEISSLPYLL